MDMEESTSGDRSSVLKKLGYEFNEQLELRCISTGKGFEFVNQAHYEELADSVAHHIQELMVQKHDMTKVTLPVEEDIHEMTEMGMPVPPELRSPIFVSKSAETADVVLVLLCGTGRVAAGQWARKLCINESLATGSVIPFLEWAAHCGIATVVMNPNETAICINPSKERVPIPYCSTAEEHVYYVWERVLKRMPCKHFVMVAHSYGGVGTCHLLKLAGKDILDRVRAVAFTDGVHGSHTLKGLSRRAKTFLLQHSINWVASEEALDTELQLPSSRTHSDTTEGLTEFAILSRMGVSPWAARKMVEAMDEREQDPEEAAKLRGLSAEQRSGERRRGFLPIPLGPRWPRLEGEAGTGDGVAGLEICCKEVSAGSDVHEKTTMSAFDSVCRFLLGELLEMEWEPPTQASSFLAPPAQAGENRLAEVADWLGAPPQRRQVAVMNGHQGVGEGVGEGGGQEGEEEGGRESGFGDHVAEGGEEEEERLGGERRRAHADEDSALTTETQNRDGENTLSQEAQKAEGVHTGTASCGGDEGGDEGEGESRDKGRMSEGNSSGGSRKRNHAAAGIRGLQD